jgi:hypothetical protein
VILAMNPVLWLNAQVFERCGRVWALLSQYGGNTPRERGKNPMNRTVNPPMLFCHLGVQRPKIGSFFTNGTSSRALRPVHGRCVNDVALGFAETEEG